MTTFHVKDTVNGYHPVIDQVLIGDILAENKNDAIDVGKAYLPYIYQQVKDTAQNNYHPLMEYVIPEDPEAREYLRDSFKQLGVYMR